MNAMNTSGEATARDRIVEAGREAVRKALALLPDNLLPLTKPTASRD